MERLSLTIALVAVLSLAGAGCGNTRPAIATPSTLAGVSLAHPLIGAQRMSLAAARRAVKFRVPQAGAAVARPAQLTAVWVDKKTQAVALVYGGDVTVMMARARYHDPKTEFSRFLSENHATARLGSIGRNIALVIAPHSDAKRSNPAWVEFDDDGVDINLASATQGTAVLLAVARSLAGAQGPTTAVAVCGPPSRQTLESSRTACADGPAPVVVPKPNRVTLQRGRRLGFVSATSAFTAFCRWVARRTGWTVFCPPVIPRGRLYALSGGPHLARRLAPAAAGMPALSSARDSYFRPGWIANFLSDSVAPGPHSIGHWTIAEGSAPALRILVHPPESLGAPVERRITLDGRAARFYVLPTTGEGFHSMYAGHVMVQWNVGRELVQVSFHGHTRRQQQRVLAFAAALAQP